MLLNAALHHSGRDIKIESESGKHICRPRTACDSTVPMFGDCHAGSGGDKTCRCRNIERSSGIPARSDNVEHIRHAGVDERSFLTHRPRCSGNLIGPLPLHAESDKQSGNLRFRSPALHQQGKAVERLLRREILPAHDSGKIRCQHAALPALNSPTILRKFAS